MADGSLIFDTKIDSAGFNKGTNAIKSQSKGLSSAFSKLGKAATLAFSVTAIVNFAKESVKANTDLENATMGLKSTTQGQGRSFQQANGFIQNYISDGLMPATDAITTYKNLAMRGYSDDQIEKTMVRLKDSASLGRQSSLSLGQAVSSASEGLKNENSILVDNAGVTKNVSMMWKDYADSIGVGVGSLTKQQKIQAEVNGIMTETRFQTGDAAKVANSYSGQMMKLGFVFNNLKIAVGNFIKPIATVVMPILSSAMKQITIFFNILGQISSELFGVQFGGVEQSQKQASSINDSVNNEKALADATKKTNKEKEKQLASFDEMNVLSTSKEEKSSDGGVGEVSGGDVTSVVIPPVKTSIDTSPINSVVQKIKDMIAPLQQISFDNLSKAFENLKIAVSPFTENVGLGLKWLYDNVLVPLATWAIEDLLPAFLNLLAGAISFLNAMIVALTPLFTWLWGTFLQPIAVWTGGVIVSVLEGIGKALTAIGNWITNNQEAVQVITIVILAFFAAWKLTEVMSFIGMAGSVSAAFVKIGTSIFGTIAAKIADKIETIALTALYAKDFIVSVTNSTIALAKQIIQWVSSTAAKIANTIATVASTVATAAWNAVCAIGTAITTAFGAAVAFLTSPIGLVIVAIGALIAIVVLLVKNWDTVKEACSKCWEWIKSIFSSAWNWLKTKVVDPIAKLFKSLWDGIAYAAKMAWWGIQVSVISMANFIISVINLMIKGVLAPFNVLIAGLNLLPGVKIQKLKFEISKIDLPPIPKLATGTVVPANYGNFLATLGDNKREPEIVSPLSTMKKAVKEALSERGESTNGSPITIVLKVGATEFARTTINAINDYTRQTGELAIDLI